MAAFKHLSPCLCTAAEATCFLTLVYRKMHTRDSSFQHFLIRLLRLRSEESNFKGNFLELAPVLPAYQSSLLKKLISLLPAGETLANHLTLLVHRINELDCCLENNKN